jgi:hypothetical protein
MLKNRIVFVRDHSASMRNIRNAAVKDYNTLTETVRTGSAQNNQDTLVSVVECGYEDTSAARVRESLVPISDLKPLTNYQYTVDGAGTPLWDSVGLAIMELERAAQADTDKDVAMLVFVTTDGQENSSWTWTLPRLSKKIQELQATGQWSFVFRVPRGQSHYLTTKGIPSDNIIEWEQTEQGQAKAQFATEQAFGSYFSDRGRGITSTRSFYANMANVTTQDVKAALTDISSQVQLIPVPAQLHGKDIAPFVAGHIRGEYKKGTAFYQLTKTEKEVQAYKIIVIRDKNTGATYAGHAARQLLSIPTTGTIKLTPDRLGKFEVYIQSTSLNRKLVGGSQVLYWPHAQ